MKDPEGGHDAVHDGRRDGDGDGGDLGFASGDLGRIQGILLGDHARRIDTRFTEHESMVEQRLQNLVAELETTNQGLRGEIEILKAELAEERAARLESMRLATEERAAFSHEMDRFKSQVDKERSASAAALAELRADSVANVDDLSSRVDDEVTQINEQFMQQGVHRESLSEILRKAADQISASSDGDSDSSSNSE